MSMTEYERENGREVKPEERGKEIERERDGRERERAREQEKRMARFRSDLAWCTASLFVAVYVIRICIRVRGSYQVALV